MAQGDTKEYPISRGMALSYEAIVGAVGVTDGIGWILTTGFNRMSVHVEGITTGTVQIRGSNAPDRPADATDAFVVDEITSDELSNLTALPKWIKVMVSAWTTGTFNVYILLRP